MGKVSVNNYRWTINFNSFQFIWMPLYNSNVWGIIDSFLGQSLENITAEALDNKMGIIDLPREHFGKFIIIKEAFFEELNCSIH